MFLACPLLDNGAYTEVRFPLTVAVQGGQA